MTFQQFIRASFQEQTMFLKKKALKNSPKDKLYYAIRRELKLRRSMEQE